MRIVPRKFESVVGSALLRAGSRKMLRDSGLVKKTVSVEDGTSSVRTVLHYYERGGIEPAIVFYHGLSDEAKNFAGFIASLDLPNRILVPDAVGHGNDLERARREGESFQQPTPTRLLQTSLAFLDALNIQQCDAFGYSMGGALVYFLKLQRPKLVRRTILLSPSLEACIDEQFIQDFVQGHKNHFCFENRNDVKLLFRDLSVPHRRKQDPIPKFFLEAIWRMQQQNAPAHHFRRMLTRLIEDRGKLTFTDSTNTIPFGCSQDVDPNVEGRLVLWPEYDFICNIQQGKAFFANSTATDFRTIPDCGHMFHSDGRHIWECVLPMVKQHLTTKTTPKKANEIHS